LLCAVLSPFLLAGCSQTTSHGMSVASLASSVLPSSAGSTHVRPYRYTARDRECLERAMFFESNRSSRDGMVAVGTVVMNRLRSGKHGNTICDVVGERNQFAPGVMTRKMNSRAMPDVQEAAEAVLKGERSKKLKNAMFFHTAGLKFPYKNMHYVLVAGGNAFYEKRGRNWQPLPDEQPTMVAFAGDTPDAAPSQPVMVASAAPASGAAALPGVAQADLPETAPVAFAAVKPAKAPVEKAVEVASAEPARLPQSSPLPQNSPFALASADSGFDDGFDSAAPKAVQKKRVRVAAPAPQAVVEVASAAPPMPARKAIIDPGSAPLPTARASMFGMASGKAKKTVKAPAVQVAADEQPLAARFGRMDDAADDATSLGFAQ
jgi:hypothetical protein